MPRLIAADSDDKITRPELIDELEASDFDPRDEDNFASWGPALKKLANNRDFLAEIVMEELKQRCSGQIGNNQYSAQVIMLHNRSRKFLMRANFWPGEEDSIMRHSGPDPFFYGVPHDHVFSFLTVGYLGPGYWSDYYEYENDKVSGYSGEKVDLRFVERARLDLGKVMLYRAHQDVHLQLPADAMSVSINIMGTSHSQEFGDQYRFNVERSEIEGVINKSALEPMMALTAHFGGENGRDLLTEFANGHPSDRVRFAAVKARAAAAGGVDARLGVYEEAALSDNRYVSEMSRAEAARLRESRTWIEAGPGAAFPAVA
jgi:hypothetical protein